MVEKRVLVESDNSVQAFTKKKIYFCDYNIDLEAKLGKQILSGLNFERLFNDKYPFFNITNRILQYKNSTLSFESGM